MNEQENVPQIMSLEKFLDSIGRSRTTGYRWRKNGFLRAITISGRPYVTCEAVAEFMRRASAGELAGDKNTVKKKMQ